MVCTGRLSPQTSLISKIFFEIKLTDYGIPTPPIDMFMDEVVLNSNFVGQFSKINLHNKITMIN